MKTIQVIRQNITNVLAITLAMFFFILLSYSCKSVKLESLLDKKVVGQIKPELDTKSKQEVVKPKIVVKAKQDVPKPKIDAKAEKTQTKPEPDAKTKKEKTKPTVDAKAKDIAKPELDAKSKKEVVKPKIVVKAEKDVPKPKLDVKVEKDQAKTELDTKSEPKQEDMEIKPDDEPIMVPFYKKGKLGFSAKGMLERMKQKQEKAKKTFKKEKKDFIVLAEDRFKNIAFSFWVPPSEYPGEHPELTMYPKDGFGYPDWVAAVNRNIINPVGSISGNFEEEEMFDEDIIFEINDRMMANVRFPHSVHNYWLSCKVCHPGLFIAKKGANDVNMTKIWDGKFCGRCHGAVAFVPKGFEACIRCHRVGRERVFMNY